MVSNGVWVVGCGWWVVNKDGDRFLMIENDECEGGCDSDNDDDNDSKGVEEEKSRKKEKGIFGDTISFPLYVHNLFEVHCMYPCIYINNIT